MKIEIRKTEKTTPTDYSWQFGIGNDHAFQFHRKDVCEYAKLAHDELGIKYIRFHGILDDDMLCFQRLWDYRYFRGIFHCKNIHEINFKQVADVYDNVLSCGMKPFVEISFMPSALAKGKKTGIRYLNNITKPKNLSKWADFIKLFITFLLDRYGKEEVESWYFEIWNEPDLSIFFKGKQNDYFKLYEATVRAIKSIDDKMRVGGPSSSACLWIEDFKEYCDKKSLPYDFISTHHYPGDAFGNTFGAKDAFKMLKIARNSAKNDVDLSDTLTEMFFHPEVYKTWDKGVLKKLDEKLYKQAGEKPLFVTEWNSMAVFASPVHDSKFSSAFIIKTCMDLDNKFNGYMFWCLSDVYEEQFMLGKPFHGGFGLINNNGIPKPSFYAFKILSKLYDKRLLIKDKNENEIEYALFTNGDDLQILIWNQDQDFYKREKYPLELSIDYEASSASIEFINDDKCNPKKEWEKLGKPSLLNKKQVEEIKEKSKLKEEEIEYSSENGMTSLKLVLTTNDVALITLKHK